LLKVIASPPSLSSWILAPFYLKKAEKQDFRLFPYLSRIEDVVGINDPLDAFIISNATGGAVFIMNFFFSRPIS